MAALERVLKTCLIILYLLGICFSVKNDSSVKLLYTNSRDIVLLDTDTGVTTTISTGNQYALFLDYHYTAGYIYWSDMNAGTITRKKFPLDGSDEEVIVADAINPVGISIDTKNDHLYWLDNSIKKLIRSDLDGSNRTEILSDLPTPTAIAMDTVNKWIYFSGTGGGWIKKCKFDGSNQQNIITDNIQSPEGILLDLNEQRIYWTDSSLGYIKSVKVDGSDVQLITSGLTHPLGIGIHDNVIYFSEWQLGKIYKQTKSPGSPKILIHSDTPYMMSVKVYKGTDECSSYIEQKNEAKRSSGYKMDLTVDTALSDDSLEENWYRFVSDNGDEMCTYPPGVLSCGTYYPIWLNGSLPSRNNGSVAMTTCLQTENDICEMTFNINIINCGGYYVYYMVKTPTNSSYCVGEGSVRCPDGMSSESGYYPGCTSSFPNSTVSPTVESVLIDGPAYQIPNVESTPSLLPVFKCNFDDIQNVTYVYDVYWYINGSSVTSYRNILYSNISTTVLRGSDWTHSYHMNMEVQCSVRLRYSVGSVPGPFIQSQVFAAGLYPENSKYTVIEGEFVNIAFTSTVPIGCISSHSDFMPLCSQNINVFQPEHDDTPSSCVNNIVSRDVVFKAEFCGIKLSTLDWNETKYLKVYGFSDGIYNQEDRSTYIQLSTTTITTLNDIWKDIQIPEIKVTVIDKDSTLTNRLCQSYNDPHITTFDGKTYHYMEVGEFVMYRNDKGPFWVHSLFTNCGFGWQGSSCHCGIAIRSRNSLFVLRTCETISRNGKHLLQQPITELKSCDDSDMLIEQYGNEYKVTLPIGTEIRFRISTWSKFITMISVKPSIYDINEAKGLCGVPSTNKDTSDDFTHRQDGPVNDYKTFADSWRITSVMTSEQLFIAEPDFLNNQQVIVIDNTFGSGDNTTSYCICERQTGSSDDLDNFNTVQCNLTESTEYCSGSSQSTEESSGTIYTSCSGLYRKKRSVRSSHTTESSNSSDSDDVVEFKPLIYDDDVNNTDEVVPNTFRNGWNESNAYQKCLESIRKALPTDLYTDVVDLEDKYFIQSCVRDIELVGGVTFLPDTIGTMMTFILTEVRRNESLFTMKTSNGSQTVLEYISSFLCPNNCSDNGNCTSGVCSCYDGFTGDDCSQEISTPPSGISLPSNGLCTLGTRKCKRTNVYGDFQSTTVWYQIKYFQILKDTQVFASDVEILEAKYRNMFMVSVELPSSRRKRDTSDTALAYGYEISLSNDRQSFGESVNIIIYDESCYTCNSTSVTCTVLESCLESSTKVTNDTVTQLNYTRSELDTTTVEPTTMPEVSTTMPDESTTMSPPTTTTVTTTTTTMIPTVKPCTNDGLNRTDMVLGEVCGQYGVDGRCTVSYSACMQSKTDTSWKCRCSQGYAKQNQQCVAMPIKLFSSGQPVMVTVQESATSGFTIKSINFDEVSGFDVSNPTAEIKGPESPLFKVPVNTTDVTLNLDGSLDRLNYVIFVTVSVTIDNVLIRDFVEVRISVSSQGVIGKNIVILHGTPKGSIIGQICTSCITGSDVISVSNSDVYGVNMEGSVFTTKPINLDTLQSTMTIFNSTYILVYKNTNLIANVTIIVIRSQYTVTLDEGSGSNTQVALLNDIFQTFKINTDGLGTSGDVINLGNITLNYEEQTEVTKTLSFTNPTNIMDPFDVLVTIKIQDVNDVPPQFQQKPYNFLAVQSAYKHLIVGVVKADDPDMSSMLTYNITPNDILSIDKQGVIKADQAIPRSNYTAMVNVSDGLFSDTVAIVVNLLLPTNTNLENEFNGTILENENADTMIKNVSINGYENYQFTDQAAYNDLRLDSITGLVKSFRPFNRENVQERQFKFTIVGNRENEVSCSLVIIGEITVNVIDVNDEPPVFINTPYTATVVEESSEEQLKMNLPMDTTDKDVNPIVSYSLVNHQDKFYINSLSGIIKTNVSINRETTPSLSISVKAYDGVNSATAVIVVTIEDINDNSPSFTNTPYNFAVDENSQIGKSVGTISANDSDIGKNAEITYQIHSDGGYFRINQTTGEITISRNLDREMNSTHKPIVYARDNGDNILSSSVTVTISVNDINDNAPLFSSDRIMVEFEENKDCSNIITNLTATDSDRPNSANSRITYSLLSGSDDFQIDPSTGSLRCQTMLNYENITSYTLLVKAQDNGSPAKLSSNKTVIINVKDINDNTPTFVKAKNSMTIRYFGTVQRVIEVLNVVDLDYGANGMVNITISGSAAAFLTINNKGILKTKVSDKPNDGSYSLTITATDMGSPTLNSSHSMTVTVSQFSTQPIKFLEQEIDMNITENSNIGTEIEIIFTKVEKPSDTTVTFEIIDEKADIKFSLNSDDGKVTLKGSIDREENEMHEFVVRVKNKDNDTQSDLALVTVQILDENDNKPIFDRENLYFKIREDSSSDTIVIPTEVKVIATDADIGMNAEIKYTLLESGGCADVFTFKENSIVLKGTIDYEEYTFCKLTVKAFNQNNETMSSTVNVHINVLDVNDNPPEFLQHTNNVYTVSVREDTTINTEIPAFGLLEDKDSRENGDIELSTVSSCLFDVRRNYDKIQLQVKPNTILDYESSIHVNTCIIKAIDKGAPPLTSTATLSISITDVNDNRPNITSPNTNVNVSRDAKVGHVIISQIHATDADSSENGELRYSLQNSQYYSKFIIDPATGRIAINSPLRSVQTDKITLMAIVSDKGIPPLSSAVEVTILITDDNPRPYLEQTPVINIQEHTQRPNDGEIVRVKAYDGVNANGVVKVCDCTFKLDTNRVDLKIDNDSGIVRFKNKGDSFDREKEYNSKVFVSVIASDKYDPPKDSDPMIITINILDINDQYPRFTQDIYHFKVYQKAPNGVQIGTVTAIDKDLAPDTRYSINITESSFSSSVVSINETTGEITKSGDMTLNQTSNTQIKGWVYAQDNKDLSKQPPDSKQITITIEFDDKNNHTPTFQLVQYNADMQWDAEVEQSIVQTMATDADSGVEGTISYSLVEGNSRGFFKIDNNGVLMLAYKLDSSIGTDATEIVTLTVKAMDGGIIPKYSSVQIIIRISGNNPGACIQGTEHSKQVLDITEERNNWSYAMYALVALLCIAIVCSLFFLYKWRTTPVPTISHPVDKDGKNKYHSSGSDYSDLGKRNTVEYSHSNQGFDPMSMLNPDPYSTVCDNDLHVATSI